MTKWLQANNKGRVIGMAGVDSIGSISFFSVALYFIYCLVTRVLMHICIT
jgi:hypothetical protein